MRVIVGGLLVAGVVVCGNVFADEATKPSAVDYNNPANQWHGDSANPATAQTANYSNQNRDLTIGLDTGYRTSQMKFNIADPTGNPNVLSELQWKSVSGYEFEPKVEYTQKTGRAKGLHLEASVNKSITTSGNNQDSDYLGNNRTGEFSRSNNSSDAGHAEGFSGAIGYAFDFDSDKRKTVARFTTLVGYAMQSQKFVSRDGNQTISAYGNTLPIGAFSGLMSSYTMDWNAPFVGAEFTSNFTNTQHIKLLGDYYFSGSYNGTGHWNLRSDLAQPDSFKHSANGNGFMLGAEYGWQFRPRWELDLSAGFSDFKTKSGTDTVNGASGVSSITRLNQAEWQSQSYMAGLKYVF